jgi:hypothetical protein
MQAPAKNCLMQLTGLSPGAKSGSFLTDSSGSYVFTEVPAGTYKVSVADDRFLSDSALTTINSDMTFSFVVYEKAHTLVAGNIPDTLTKAGSPYLVLGRVFVNKPFCLNAGAKVIFCKEAELYLYNTITAIGNQTDSIMFTTTEKGPLDSNNERICLCDYGGIFSYCTFDHLFYFALQFLPQYISFEHCLFRNMHVALAMTSSPLRKAKFANNKVLNCMYGISGGDGTTSLADSLELTDNFFQCSDKALHLGGTWNRKNYVRRNTVLGPTTFNAQSVTERDTIASNIFADLTFSNASGKSAFFAYNNVLSLSGTALLGMGTATLVNTRGDSCDFFYNIRTKPLFSDSTTGVLLNTSPCIGTGFKGENMGFYQGEGAGVMRTATHATLSNGFKVRSVRHEAAGTFLTLTGISGRYQPTVDLYGLSGKRLATKAFKIISNEHNAGTATIYIARPLSVGNYLLEIKRSGRNEFARFAIME